MARLLDALAGDAEIEALLGDDVQVAAMVEVEIALARAQADVGMIGDDAASAIAEGLAGFTPDWDALAQGVARDGVVVPALLAQLRLRIAPEHALALHQGATSQDIVDTALILQLAKVITILEVRISGLLDCLRLLEQLHGDHPMMAHTRMQRALPYTFGAKLLTWSTPLRRHLGSLNAARRSLLVVQLGGPIGDRSSLGPHANQVARGLANHVNLGLAEPWQTARDPLIGFASLLGLLTGTLGKIGADIALMAQNDIGEIAIRGGGSSSSMAHKVNPINAEVLVALARYNAGLVGTLHQAMVHENERSGAAWTLEWLTLPSILVSAGASLRIAATLLQQITFREHDDNR